MPEISFLPDKGLDEAARLDQLFQEAGLLSKRGEGSEK
jgi:ribosome-binding factor A